MPRSKQAENKNQDLAAQPYQPLTGAIGCAVKFFKEDKIMSPYKLVKCSIKDGWEIEYSGLMIHHETDKSRAVAILMLLNQAYANGEKQAALIK